MPCQNLRSLGVFACIISTVMFIAGGLSDRWVQSDNGHWGLWEICDKSIKHNVTSNITTSSTPTSVSGFDRHHTSTHAPPPDDGDENEDEEDKCTAFNLGSIPAFLHIVRLIMVVTGITFAWGLLSGRTLRTRIYMEGSFVQTHKAELLGLIASVSSFLGLLLFIDNYKTVHEETFTNSSLGWSYHLVRVSVFLYMPTGICLMAPSIHTKYKTGCHGIFPSIDDCDLLRRLCIRIGLKKPRTHNSQNLHVARGVTNSSVVRRRNSLVSNESEINTQTEIADGIHDISLQMSDTNSDIFTVTMTNEDSGSTNRNTEPSGGPMSDLPQYEDVARSSSCLPPPPSYDDVIAGQYLTFSSSASSSHPLADSSSGLPPPPAYTPSSNA